MIADLKKHEGILIPQNFKYWFESASDEPLESCASLPGIRMPRTNGSMWRR